MGHQLTADVHHQRSTQQVASWLCCSGCEPPAAPGMSRHAKVQQQAVTCRCCNGPTRMGAHEMRRHAGLQQRVATWQYCNGPVVMAARAWDGRTCSAAAEGGHLAVLQLLLQWACESGCPWDE